MTLFNPKEYKVVCIRDCPLPADMQLCDTPDQAADYWHRHVVAHPAFNPDVECFVALLLNTRRRLRGHVLISTGILDQVVVHPREVFRPALIASASALILGHNHPSGDPTPSEADIKITRDLVRAGQLLKVDVLDHVIVGRIPANGYKSLRELGHFP